MILADYHCASCETVREYAVDSPSPDGVPCSCGTRATWVPTPIIGTIATSVARGKVARPDSPMFCDTRNLGEGQPLHEWKEERRKMYQERRHREYKRGD